MKVFALGGYGKVGVPALKMLAQNDLVTEITIAGRNIERAKEMAEEIGKKATAVRADGTNEQELTSLLAGYDIIMNAASNAAVLPGIRAAISNGAHYSDAAWGATIDQALQLASERNIAGITAVVATGVSPCISNLMGVYAARQLDEVEQLQLGRSDMYNFRSGDDLTPRLWLQDPKESLVALSEFKPFITMALKTLQDSGIQTIRVFHDGQWMEADPIRSGINVPLIEGVTSYPYYSGDPLSSFGCMPGNLSRIPPVEVWLSPFPPRTHGLLREQALRVVDGHIDTDAAVNSFYSTIAGDPHLWLTLPDDFIPTPKMWVSAEGRKDGRAARYSCWFTAPMWNVGGYFLTSVALVASVLKILRGEVGERGVMTAEKAFEPMSFFDEVIALLPDPPPDGKLIGESFEWLE